MKKIKLILATIISFVIIISSSTRVFYANAVGSSDVFTSETIQDESKSVTEDVATEETNGEEPTASEPVTLEQEIQVEETPAASEIEVSESELSSKEDISEQVPTEQPAAEEITYGVSEYEGGMLSSAIDLEDEPQAQSFRAQAFSTFAATGYNVNFSNNTNSAYASYNYKYAFEVLTLVNQYRAENGVAPLQMDRDLLEAAMQRALEVYVNFDHTRPNGTSFATIKNDINPNMVNINAENIAYGYPTPKMVMMAWKSSPGHRTNLLNPNWKSMGAGIAGPDGWAQLYSSGTATPVSSSAYPTKKNVTHTVQVNLTNTPTNMFVEAVKGSFKAGTALEFVTSMQNYSYEYGSFNLNPDQFKLTTSSTNVRVDGTKLQLLQPGSFTVTLQHLPTGRTINYTNTVLPGDTGGTPTDPTKPVLTYQSHVANIGWQNPVNEGQLGGTTGRGLQLEALKINLQNGTGVSGSITYQAHVKNIGWQDIKTNGAIAGTTGQSLHVEALRISLTGELANQYDIYYRIHAAEFGWLDWAKNGMSAGSEGYGRQAEAFEIRLVKKGQAAPGATTRPYAINPKFVFTYQGHSQNVGWQNYVGQGAVAGTTGQGYHLEAIRLQLQKTNAFTGSVSVNSHVRTLGWQGYKDVNNIIGTTGRNLPLQGIQVQLTGDLGVNYDVYYRVHVSEYGWLGWAKNGVSAGTTNANLHAEAVQIIIVPKGSPAPGTTTRPFV